MGMTWDELLATLTPRQPAPSATEQKRVSMATITNGVICPDCGQRCAAQATVTKWLEPAEWDFYGQPGNRAIKCQGSHFVHFWVGTSNGKQDRIAWCQERHNWRWT